MNNNLFLKKYKKSCELVTKEGPLGILNHLHYNIIGFKPKAKKKKKPPPKKPEPDYSYVTSIVKYDFNQNKNFVPQLSNLLNYLKNKEMNNNIIKSRTQLKKNNNNEEKHYNFIKNDNNNDDAFNTKIIRKKLKFKTDNEKQNYINLDKLTEQNTLKFKNKRIQNQIVNKSQSMTSNNDINSYIFDKNSNKILPLINHSQDMNNYLKINKMNNNSKIKSFTPFINRQSRIYDKNKIRKFHFNKEIINNEILKKSNSTMNIYRKNNDDINIENNYIYNYNEINNDKINNLFSKEIAENKNNEEIKERNLNMIKQRINKFNELKIKNNQIEDNHKYLNIIDEEEDENSKNSNVNNNKNLNLLQILMKQRQQYFKNIENSIKYQNAMPMDF